MDSVVVIDDQDRVSKPVSTKRRAKWGKKQSIRDTKIASIPSTQQVKRMIKREIARQAETKIIEGVSGNVAFAQSITPSSCYPLIPNISQGTTQGARIGNRVTVRKAILRMSLTVSNQAASVAPTYVDIYIFKYLPIKSYPNNVMPTGSMNNFLQAGSTSTSYTGVITDGLRPVNKDLFSLKYRKRLCMFNPNNTASFVGATAMWNPNRSYNIDITKYINKTLEYDDANSYCTNDGLWFAVGSTQTDGVLYPGLSMGTFNIVVNVEYEDS